MKNATFTVGVLPLGLWDVISTQNFVAFEEAKRRAIAKLAAEGLDPEAIEEGWTATMADRLAANDEQSMRSLQFRRLEAVRYGLKMHSGFKTRNGKVVPFETEYITVDGQSVKVVAESTLKFYRVNPKLVTNLYLSLMKVNTLSDLGKKA